MIEGFTYRLVPIATFIAGFVISYLGSLVLLIICSIGLLATTMISLFNKSIDNLVKKTLT